MKKFNLITWFKNRKKIKKSPGSSKECEKLKKDTSITDDNISNPVKETEDRYKIYTEMIETFYLNFKYSGYIRDILKIIFFILISSILITVNVLFIYVVYKSYKIFNSSIITVEDVAVNISSIIASLCAVLVAFSKLPNILAEYLFDPQEEKYRIQLISYILNFDNKVVDQKDRQEMSKIAKQAIQFSDKNSKLGSLGTRDSEKDVDMLTGSSENLPTPTNREPSALSGEEVPVSAENEDWTEF